MDYICKIIRDSKNMLYVMDYICKITRDSKNMLYVMDYICKITRDSKNICYISWIIFAKLPEIARIYVTFHGSYLQNNKR